MEIKIKNIIAPVLNYLKSVADNQEIIFTPFPNCTKSYCLPFCCQYQMTYLGIRIQSWGNGKSLDEASFKGAMELLERFCYISFFPFRFKKNFWEKEKSINELSKRYNVINWVDFSTSGTAIHTSKVNSRQAAWRELIERHVILKGHALNIKPKSININNFIKDYQFPIKLHIEAFYYNTCKQIKVVVLKTKKNKAILYAFGCHKSLKKAVTAAVEEATGMILYLNGDIRSIKTTSNNLLHKIRNYHLSGLGHISDHLYSGNSSNNNIDIDIDIDIDKLSKANFLYSTFNLRKVLTNFPPINIYYSKCISPKTQPLVLDIWKNAQINIKAIAKNEIINGDELHVVA